MDKKDKNLIYFFLGAFDGGSDPAAKEVTSSLSPPLCIPFRPFLFSLSLSISLSAPFAW